MTDQGAGGGAGSSLTGWATVSSRMNEGAGPGSLRSSWVARGGRVGKAVPQPGHIPFS